MTERNFVSKIITPQKNIYSNRKTNLDEKCSVLDTETIGNELILKLISIVICETLNG
jgi:hypothetical protein